MNNCTEVYLEFWRGQIHFTVHYDKRFVITFFVCRACGGCENGLFASSFIGFLTVSVQNSKERIPCSFIFEADMKDADYH